MFAIRRSLAAASVRSLSSQARSASTLVVADHDGKAPAESLVQVVAVANKLGNPLTVLVAGKGVAGVADAVAKRGLEGVTKVVCVDAAALEHPVAETLAATVAQLHASHKFAAVVANSSPINKNWVPRFAVGIDVQPVSDVIAVKAADTFARPTYAGNAIATVRSKDAVKVLTVRASSFDKAPAGGAAAAVETVTAAAAVEGRSAKWESEAVAKSDRPELSAAKIVIAGGRGMKSGENFAMLNELADLMGGAVGASRAAVDAGFVPNDLQVGQTGKIVAPDLYVAVGISGAIQHLAGMKDSKTIVAINKDAEAPIFQVADLGLVDDLFTAVPALTKQIKAAKGK